MRVPIAFVTLLMLLALCPEPMKAPKQSEPAERLEGIAIIVFGGTVCSTSTADLCARDVQERLDSTLRKIAATDRDIRIVLLTAGLDNVEIRPDAGDGRLFGGTTAGQACIVGTYGPYFTSVTVAAPLADGKCLPSLVS